jgi:hypothetical protein
VDRPRLIPFTPALRSSAQGSTVKIRAAYFGWISPPRSPVAASEKYMFRALLVLAVALAALPACAQQIPRVDVTTLSNRHVVLPTPGSTKPIVIVIAFSARGGEDTSAWNRRFQSAYTSDSRFEYLELADFQGIPAFLTRMILRAIRRSVREPERSHLAPFYTAEDAWKGLVGASNTSIAYVLVADPSGHIVFQTHGPATDAKAAAVQNERLRLEHQSGSAAH